MLLVTNTGCVCEYVFMYAYCISYSMFEINETSYLT